MLEAKSIQGKLDLVIHNKPQTLCNQVKRGIRTIVITECRCLWCKQTEVGTCMYTKIACASKHVDNL